GCDAARFEAVRRDGLDRTDSFASCTAHIARRIVHLADVANGRSLFRRNIDNVAATHGNHQWMGFPRRMGAAQKRTVLRQIYLVDHRYSLIVAGTPAAVFP